jgi:hypothetical protein
MKTRLPRRMDTLATENTRARLPRSNDRPNSRIFPRRGMGEGWARDGRGMGEGWARDREGPSRALRPLSETHSSDCGVRCPCWRTRRSRRCRSSRASAAVTLSSRSGGGASPSPRGAGSASSRGVRAPSGSGRTGPCRSGCLLNQRNSYILYPSLPSHTHTPPCLITLIPLTQTAPTSAPAILLNDKFPPNLRFAEFLTAVGPTCEESPRQRCRAPTPRGRSSRPRASPKLEDRRKSAAGPRESREQRRDIITRRVDANKEKRFNLSLSLSVSLSLSFARDGLGYAATYECLADISDSVGQPNFPRPSGGAKEIGRADFPRSRWAGMTRLRD